MNEIREKFLKFFSANDHIILPSSPLIPHNDPTLLFVNSGMVQFKDYFLNKKVPPYNNITTAQKCVRAGGKHNDLENVGYTKRHHTFFEMLGNFSFSGYFKANAIKLAWQFLTEELKLEPKKLYVTIYYNDDEAYNIWQELTGFDSKRIIRISTKDNFWQMAETGPCGPCSEIFYDHGEGLPGELPADNAETGERYVEIWNLVFMQFSRDETGVLHSLHTPCIDTGMGLERITAVLEGTDDNYKTSLFQALIKASKEASGNSANDIAHRIIADHLRASAFLIADGIMPSNTGRGYVLRRIIRRAVRYIYVLGSKKLVLSALFPVLEEFMAPAYPELMRAKNSIINILDSEETSFKLTLKGGLELLNNFTKDLKAGDILKGEIAFTLYDTYGFPLDLTIDILKEKNISINEREFEASMETQKTRAKKAWVGSGEGNEADSLLQIYNNYGETKFLGYEHHQGRAKIIAILDEKNQFITSEITKSAKAEANKISSINLILDQTPFYGEAGGQEGDHGLIYNNNDNNDIRIKVTGAKKTTNNIIIHNCQLLENYELAHYEQASNLHSSSAANLTLNSNTHTNSNSNSNSSSNATSSSNLILSLKVGDEVFCQIDEIRRAALRRNHSATHLLHFILRKELGEHVVQKGSLVASDRLRFDFSYGKALTKQQLQTIERKVNLLIWQNLEVSLDVKNLEEAMKSGAMALFGAKYANEVRIIKIGDSTELCGGTHVHSSGEIGLFKIISESSIAVGIRRIEAVTNIAALDFLQEEKDHYTNQITDLNRRIKENDKLKTEDFFKLYKNIIENIPFEEETFGTINLKIKVVNNIPNNDLRRVATEIRNIEKNSVLIFCNRIKEDKQENKINRNLNIASNISNILCVFAITEDLLPEINTGELIDLCKTLTNIEGGGNKGLAQVLLPAKDLESCLIAIRNKLNKLSKLSKLSSIKSLK